MSSCEVYRVSRRGVVRLYGRARNSWGGAIHVWAKLAEELGLVGSSDWERDAAIGGAIAGRNDILKKVWREAECPSFRLTVWQRVVLATTLDDAMVMRADIPLVCSALSMWLAWDPTETLEEERAILTAMAADRKTRAVVWNQTSVNGDTWWAETKNGEGRPWNVDRDGKAWDIFREIPDLRAWAPAT